MRRAARSPPAGFRSCISPARPAVRRSIPRRSRPSCPASRASTGLRPAPSAASFDAERGGRGRRPRRRRGRAARSASMPPEAAPNASRQDRTTASGAGDLLPLFEIPGKGKAFVDLQNDVTASDVRLAQREGFESVEHLKRYTTLGMAADQGKTSNLNGLAILAEARGLPIPAVGTTRFRPPYNPVSLGALAGRARGAHIAAAPAHAAARLALKAGGEMMNVGLWQRPRVYAEAGETLEQAYVREARAVRASVGITDVSTLGKIDVQGPDAATFLDRVYTNTFSTLPVGKARYGLMLRDDGFLYDDGTTWRLADNRYLMTTTTASARARLPESRNAALDRLAGAEGVARLADRPMGRRGRRRTEQPRAAGEGARRHRRERRGPALHGRAGRASRRASRCWWRGSPSPASAPTRSIAAPITRSPSGSGCSRRARNFRVVPYGLEALGTLRIEKGHVTHAEMDGRTTRSRPRARKDVLDEEGFRRQAAGASAGADRSRPQAARRPEIARRQGGPQRRASRRRAPIRRSQAAARATSPPCASARRWRATSRWRCCSAAGSGTAKSSSPPIRCAAGMARSKSSTPASSTRTGAACMAERLSALVAHASRRRFRRDASAYRRFAPAQSCRCRPGPRPRRPSGASSPSCGRRGAGGRESLGRGRV